MSIERPQGLEAKLDVIRVVPRDQLSQVSEDFSSALLARRRGGFACRSRARVGCDEPAPAAEFLASLDKMVSSLSRVAGCQGRDDRLFERRSRWLAADGSAHGTPSWFSG